MKVDSQELSGFAVQPKMDCPHINEVLAGNALSFIQALEHPTSTLECLDCKDASQNWLCLICKAVHCSRYVKGHMAEHNQSTNHEIGLSFRDGSFWCYACDSYIDSPLLRATNFALSKEKIKEEEEKKKGEKKEMTEEEKEKVKELERLFKLMGIKDKQEDKIEVTLEEIATGLKEKKFKKVLVLSGAGLSVAAGIPDFRSPGTGLYSKLSEYKLPYPEAIFELSYFKSHPTAFLTLAKQLLTAEYEPTLGHRFIKKLQDEDILLMNMTQNIDDLEIKAGVKEEKLLQAHGHSRSAHCVNCKTQADIIQWKEKAAKEEAMNCKCGGLVKPDIVFFGQALPQAFFSAPNTVSQCDLAFVIGTSLKVNPFAYLAQIIPSDVPVVLINREDVMDRNRKLWLEGDIQENIEKIMKAAGWL